MSEAVETKARRLLVDGAVAVLSRDGWLAARVLGDHGDYLVTRDPLGFWICECPAWSFRVSCSHVAAVRMVVSPPTHRLQ